MSLTESKWTDNFSPIILNRYEDLIKGLHSFVIFTEVSTELQCLDLLNHYSRAKEWLDELDEIRKRANEPHRKAIQRTNDQIKVFTDCLIESIAIINQKREAFEQSEIKRLEQAKIEAKEQSEALGIDLSLYVPESPKKLVSEHATTMTKEIRCFRVVKQDLIPHEYLMVDEKKVAQAIKMGIREIPGIEITTEKKTMIRRR